MSDKKKVVEGFQNNESSIFNPNTHPSVDKVKLASASEAELRALAGGGAPAPYVAQFKDHARSGPCLYCGEIVVDGAEESGFTGIGPDWMTKDGDFGCGASPETTEEGVGSHARPGDIHPSEQALGGTASKKKADMPGVVPEGSPSGYTEYFAFLDELRASGATNMFGAAPYLMDEFGLDKVEARKILATWMENFATDHEPEVDDKVAKQASLKLSAKEPLFKSRLIWALVDLHGAFGGDWNMIRKMLHVRYPKHKKEIDNFLGAVSRNVESIHVLAKMAAAKGCDICEGHGTVPNGQDTKACPECGGSGDMSKPKTADVEAEFDPKRCYFCGHQKGSHGHPNNPQSVGCMGEEGQPCQYACGVFITAFDEPFASRHPEYLKGLQERGIQNPRTAGVAELWGDATKYLSDLAKSLLGTADAYEEMADAVDAYEKLDGASADEAIEADDRMMEKGSAWQAGVEGKCPGCNHSLKKLSDGSYLCHDDDCECVCGSHLDKEAAKTAAGELSLEQASQILARFAKAESMRKTRLAELEAEIEEKYKLVEAAPLKGDAIKKVTEGMAALKTQQRRFEGVIFRLTDVLHRKSFRPTEFMKMVKALFEGQTEMQLKINELEQAATKPQSTTTELEVVVPEGAMEEPVASEPPAPAAKPAKEPASKDDVQEKVEKAPEPKAPKAKKQKVEAPE